MLHLVQSAPSSRAQINHQGQKEPEQPHPDEIAAMLAEARTKINECERVIAALKQEIASLKYMQSL